MSQIPFSLVAKDGEANITAFVRGTPLVAHSSHPNFAEIREELEAQIDNGPAYAAELEELFDIPSAIERRFEQLSKRVAVQGEQVLYEGEPVDQSITDQILRFMDEGQDFTNLVRFIERLQANPNQHSIERLYRWLARKGFTILPNGKFLAYKGVSPDRGSVRTGPAIVDGVPVHGHVPNHDGNVIELPRDQVQFDPSQGCASGLHAGTYEYAAQWGSVVVEVAIDPRDVVSVPTDSVDAKLRVCRYTVLREADGQRDRGFYDYDTHDDEDSYDYKEDEPEVDTNGKSFRRTGERRRPNRGERYLSRGTVVKALSPAFEYIVEYDIVELV